MTFSFMKEWQEMFERIVSRTTWKEDLLRGLETLGTGGGLTVDRSFSEVEMIRFRRQLEQVDEKISLVYRALGKKSMEHWNHQQELDGKEKSKAIFQIDVLTAEKEKILEQMTTWKKTSSCSDVSSPSPRTGPRGAGSEDPCSSLSE